MIPLNMQPKESDLSLGAGDELDVVGVWSTIQGEGPFAGQPATFVRLAGCNQKCVRCDTDYTTGRRMILAGDLFVEICREATRAEYPSNLVVLTGGEPYRQSIGLLVGALLTGGCRVQIETNGTLYQELPWVQMGMTTIVCSPKDRTIHSSLLPHIDAYKYVLSHDRVNPNNGLPSDVLGMNFKPAYPLLDFPHHRVYLQPCDSGDEAINALNQEAVVKSCLKYGWTVSLQLHKILGLE